MTSTFDIASPPAASAAAPGAAPAGAPLTHRTLGDFTVGDKLGEGGYGVVYRARQRTLGREAVIKVLHARHGTNEALVQRFLREAQLASRLDHPFAAHIYAFGAEPDGLLWIAMELVRGTTLRDVLDAQPGGRLPLARLVPLLDGLCEVVHTAHEQGIVHRDLKPDNVMVLSRAGRLLPKLLDLGIAKLVTTATVAELPASATPAAAAPLAARGPTTAVGLRTQPMFDERGQTLALDASAADASAASAIASASGTATQRDGHDPGPVTQAGAIIGSPHYMAPEQWHADDPIEYPVDARADQYALGVVAFEMIAGALPFRGASLPDIARAHLHDAPPPLPDGAPPALAGVLARALAKRPADRFPSVLAFAEAVRAAAGLRVAAEALPRLDDALRAEIAWLPQPIADAIAELEAARNPHQARDAVWEIVRIAARWLGILALSARSRTTAPGGDAPAVTSALRELYRRDLADDEWLELVRGLTRPFAALRDAYPIPELIDFALTEPSPFQPLLALHAAEGAATTATTEQSVRDWLSHALPILAPLLRSLAFLGSYQLIVPCGADDGAEDEAHDGRAARADRAEVWMATRRAARPVIAIPPGLPAGEPVIADLDGRPVLALAPLVVVAPPAPGAPDELFLFAGAGRIRGHGARLIAEPHGFERHDEQIWRWFRASLLADDDDGPAAVEQAPYRGLAAFTEADAEAFFGRERAATAFVNQLLEQPLLAIVGPSGTGKSSFLRAGVIPALPVGWRAVVVRPGAAPMVALAARLAAAAAPVAAASSVGAGETLVVAVDQLEELFTLCLDPGERDRFAAELARLARSADQPTRVVLTVRDDFLARTGELTALRDRLARAVTLLATPADDDLVRVLVEPARRAGYDFDAGLAQRMVATVAGRPGALALLSFTALRLWELRDRHFKRLTASAYDAIGGVEGALARHAEHTLQACTGEEQRLVREAFRQLVTAENTRAVVSRSELLEVLGTSPAAHAVIDRLIEARLVVVAEGDAGDERIEIIHEALLAAWPRLVEWRRDDADGARLRDQLHAAARQWHDRDRPRGLLWRDEALDDYTRWRARWPGALPELDRAFGDASLRDAARGRRIRRALGASATAILIAGLVGLALLYRSSQRSAELASTALIDSLVQQGQKELFGGDYIAALPPLARAYVLGDRSVALRMLLHRAIKLADQPRATLHGPIVDAAFRPGGREVLAIGYDGDAAVIDAATGRLTAQLPGPAGPLNHTVAGSISGDGSVIASARGDSVVIWDGAATRSIALGAALDARTTRLGLDATGSRLAIANGAELAVWRVRDGRKLWSAAIGKTTSYPCWAGDRVAIATASGVMLASDGGVRALGPAELIHGAGADRFFTIEPTRVVVRAATGDVEHVFELPDVTAVSLSNDGSRIALGLRDGVVEIAEVASGRRRALLVGHTGRVAAVAFAPDDRRLVTLAADHTTRVWDLEHSRELVRYTGFDGLPIDLRVALDGRHVVVAWADDVRIYPIDDPSATLVIDAHEQVGAAQFAAGATQIFTTSDSGVQLWNARSGQRLLRLETHVGDGAHLSPDGRLIAIPLADSHDVELRDPGDGSLRGRLTSSAPVMWAAFDPAGQRIATINDTGVIEVWKLDGTRLATLSGHTAVGQDVAFAPDGRSLVSASNDRTARIWDVAGARELVRVAHTDEVYAARFDRAGSRFISAGADRKLALWDTVTGREISAFHHDAALRSAAINGGTLVAGATFTGVIQLWDVMSGKEAGRFRHATTAMAVDFADDRLLSTSIDGRIIVWDVASDLGSPDQVVAFACHNLPPRSSTTNHVLACGAQRGDERPEP